VANGFSRVRRVHGRKGRRQSGSVAIEVEVEFSGDIRQRVRMEGPPEQVLKVAPVAFELVRDMMNEGERARIRKRFVAAAHVVVFGVAALSIVGLALDFANVRDFNTAGLFSMGVWVLGSIIYFYLAIIKDVFGLKVTVPKPPTLPPSRPD
jgi:hypothetical protein